MQNFSVSTNVDIFAFVSHPSLPASHISHALHRALSFSPQNVGSSDSRAWPWDEG